MWTYTNSTSVNFRFTSQEDYWDGDWYGFKLMIKCMTGSTMNKGKFIVAVPEKMTYSESFERCDRLGLQMALPVTSEEQSFINSVTD